MADVYLRSTDGDDADDGSTWALADATLVASMVAAGAGGVTYVSDVHAETQATTMILVGSSSMATPNKIVCGDDVAEPPTSPSKAATVSMTGTSSSTSINFRGIAYAYGITFSSSGTMACDNVSQENAWIFEQCTINMANASASSRYFSLGASANNLYLMHLKNSDLNFAHANRYISITSGFWLWEGGAFTGTSPINLFTSGGRHGKVVVRDVDLSLISGNLVGTLGDTVIDILFERCKLHASVTLSSAVMGNKGQVVRMHGCDVSTGKTIRIEEQHYEGSIVDEQVIVMTDGSSDDTDSFSINMTTHASGQSEEYFSPLVYKGIPIWNNDTTQKTFTVEIIHDSVTALQDDEVWMTASASGSDMKSDIASDIVGTSSPHDDNVAGTNPLTSINGSPTNQATSTVAWTTTGLSNPNKQKLELTITPEKVGGMMICIYLAKDNYTIYVNNEVTVT